MICQTLAPALRLSLKWPNDLLAGSRKLGGLLLESETQDEGLAIVIGFGLNLASAPEGMPFPTTSLLEFGYRALPEQALTLLSDAWSRLEEVWRRDGFAEIRRRWLARAACVGEAISIVTGDRLEAGIFETLDEQGRLILRRPDGDVRAVSAGDVFFGDVATAGAAS